MIHPVPAQPVRTSRLVLACTAATALLSGCEPIYSPSQVYSLAGDLAARPLEIEFDLRGMPVRLAADGLIVEGMVTEVDVEALRIGQTWYPVARMRDPADDYVRNMFTTVRYQTRFIDAETGELIDRFIDANRIRRVRLGEQWYETSRIRFLDSPHFDNPDFWVDQRVQVRTVEGRMHEGLIVPIDSETFSVNGEVLAVSDLEAFATVTRCFECEGARGFLFMAIAPFAVIGSLTVAGVLLARHLKRRKRTRV